MKLPFKVCQCDMEHAVEPQGKNEFLDLRQLDGLLRILTLRNFIPSLLRTLTLNVSFLSRYGIKLIIAYS